MDASNSVDEDVAIVDDSVEVLPCGLLFHEKFPWDYLIHPLVRLILHQ
jgi:hypothetical protein